MAIDLRDVTLEATAEVQAVLMEVTRELTEPQQEALVRRMWAEMPEEMKAQFQKEDPQGFAALMDLLDE
jgi:hypothetical protein